MEKIVEGFVGGESFSLPSMVSNLSLDGHIKNKRILYSALKNNSA